MPLMRHKKFCAVKTRLRSAPYTCMRSKHMSKTKTTDKTETELSPAMQGFSNYITMVIHASMGAGVYALWGWMGLLGLLLAPWIVSVAILLGKQMTAPEAPEAPAEKPEPKRRDFRPFGAQGA
jgi:hypothetical protein